MIHPEHLPSLEKLARFYRSPMLGLGKTGSAVQGFEDARAFFSQWVDEYEELDLDGGDIQIDLNYDTYSLKLHTRYETVFNMGTLEHVWNAHVAWATALRAVKVGGYFLSVGPGEGLWMKHGIHATNPEAIRAFLRLNGFIIVEWWMSKRKSALDIMWLAAKKERHIGALISFKPPHQVYKDGRKGAIE